MIVRARLPYRIKWANLWIVKGSRVATDIRKVVGRADARQPLAEHRYVASIVNHRPLQGQSRFLKGGQRDLSKPLGHQTNLTGLGRELC